MRRAERGPAGCRGGSNGLQSGGSRQSFGLAKRVRARHLPARIRPGRENVGWRRNREEGMKLTRRSVNSGLAASLAAPAILRRAWADGSTIKIGMVLPVTGPAADNGKYSLS